MKRDSTDISDLTERGIWWKAPVLEFLEPALELLCENAA